MTLTLDGTAGRPGYQKAEAFKVKEVQVQIGSGNKMQETAPYSHALHPELNLGAANVRNLRSDGLTTAGDKNTRIPPWNPIPGVGGDTVQRCVFEAYQDSVRSRAARAPPGAGASQQSQGPGPSALARGPARARVLPGRRLTRTDVCTQTNKFRDTRRFARMNNPTIPRGAALNIITGEIAEASPLPAPPPPYCCPYPYPHCTLPPPARPALSLVPPSRGQQGDAVDQRCQHFRRARRLGAVARAQPLSLRTKPLSLRPLSTALHTGTGAAACRAPPARARSPAPRVARTAAAVRPPFLAAAGRRWGEGSSSRQLNCD